MAVTVLPPFLQAMGWYRPPDDENVPLNRQSFMSSVMASHQPRRPPA